MDPEAPAPQLPKRKRLLRKRVLLIPGAIATILVLIAKTVLMPVQVAGDSMSPTYRDGDIHFIYKLAYREQAPQRGDVVGIRAADGDLYIKRIVGLPHDVISIIDGEIYIEGRRLKEPFIQGSIPADIDPIVLQPQEYFVVGDNRTTSVLLAIGRNRIVGKVVR